MADPTHLVLATGNAGKIAELGRLLGARGITTEARDLPSPEEDAATCDGNAAIKALAAARATGLPCLGDDVGLEVDALGGAPGVMLRPWVESLGGWAEACAFLATLEGSPATYRCGLALAWPDGTVRTALGSVTGTIVAPIGEGPGTEPCFRADGTDAPLPALSAAERDRVHHRAVALRLLLG
jgi:XTP/dITP diphosphohydrolase